MDTISEESESTATSIVSEEIKDVEEMSDDTRKETDQSEEVAVKTKGGKMFPRVAPFSFLTPACPSNYFK